MQVLRVTVDSPSVSLRLFDANGKSTSEIYDENLVASNVKSFVPYIPGGSYSDMGTLKAISVTQPISNTAQYFVQLEGQANVTYNLLIETLENFTLTDSRLFTEAIGTDEIQVTELLLSDSSGKLEFSAISPSTSPVVSIPGSLDLSELVGTSSQLIFHVNEIGGQQPISNISIFATDLTDQLGGTITPDELSITPSDFSVTANGSQAVNVQVVTDGLMPGVYQGSLVLTTSNAGTFAIPFTLEVQFRKLYLPVVVYR